MWLRYFTAFAVFICLTVAAGEETHKSNNMTTGIEVHGHWKLTVLDPDGSVVRVYAFENALVNPAALTTLVMNDAVSGGVYVVLTNQNASSTGTGPCNPDCEIAPAGMNIGLTPESTNLTATQTGTNFETLQLAGSVTATNSHTIDLVQSWILLCNGSTNTADQCFANPDSSSVFTSRILASGVAVTAGQIVQVTVDLTFS